MVYVDDSIVTRNDEMEQQRMSPFQDFREYINDLLQEIGKTACKLPSIHVDPNTKSGSAKDDVFWIKKCTKDLCEDLFIYLTLD